MYAVPKSSFVRVKGDESECNLLKEEKGDPSIHVHEGLIRKEEDITHHTLSYAEPCEGGK